MKFYWPVLSILFFACTPKPKPIEYGLESCSFCKMAIIDPQYGAELITVKGKIYTFDAMECLLHFMADKRDLKFRYKLTNSFDQPGKLQEAINCHYLISQNLPSPMGANLSAFTNTTEARSVQIDKGGELYDWPGLLELYNLTE